MPRLTTGEMQIETILRYCFLLVHLVSSRSLISHSIGKAVEKQAHLGILPGCVNG